MSSDSSTSKNWLSRHLRIQYHCHPREGTSFFVLAWAQGWAELEARRHQNPKLSRHQRKLTVASDIQLTVGDNYLTQVTTEGARRRQPSNMVTTEQFLVTIKLRILVTSSPKLCPALRPRKNEKLVPSLG